MSRDCAVLALPPGAHPRTLTAVASAAAVAPRVVHHPVTILYAPHRWQRRFHDSPARERALIAGIRGGKSVAGSMEFLRMVLTGKPGVSMLVGPDYHTVAQTSLETILHGMGPHNVGKWPEELLVGHNQSAKVLTLTTGDRVLYRGSDDPDSLRGPAAKCYWADEITLCKPETLTILQGRTLDTGGRGIVTGTPKGKGSAFYQTVIAQCREMEAGRVWKSDRWDVFIFPTSDNPAINLADLAQLGEQYSQKFRQQELGAQFVDWGGAAFLGEALDRCFGMSVSHWNQPKEGHRVRAGFDPAGRGQDYSVLTMVCETCRGIVAQTRVQRVPFAVLYETVGQACATWTPVTLRYDDTGLGGQAIGEELAGVVSKSSPNTVLDPFCFTAKSKAELLMYLASRLEEGLAIPNVDALAPTRAELRAYEWDDKALTTDTVMALAMGVRDLAPLGPMRETIVAADGLADVEYTAIEWRDAV